MHVEGDDMTAEVSHHVVPDKDVPESFPLFGNDAP
jgi:hypothetical protein